jgi:hydroxymethylglutaryl-CoA reductase (NADPH)
LWEVGRVLRATVGDLLELSFAGTHGAVASGMQSVAFTPASAIAAIFAVTGQDLGMVGTSSMRGRAIFPYARTWLELMDCAGVGKVYRFAQIVAAATLALEISASAAMATSGSENFFKAHTELGGKRH